jgi:hypothetical protein
LAIHPLFDWFSSRFLLFQRNKKYKVAHILAYLPCLDKAVRPNGKSGLVSGNSIAFDAFETAIENFEKIAVTKNRQVNMSQRDERDFKITGMSMKITNANMQMWSVLANASVDSHSSTVPLSLFLLVY